MGGGGGSKNTYGGLFLDLDPEQKMLFIFLNNNSKNKPKMGF